RRGMCRRSGCAGGWGPGHVPDPGSAPGAAAANQGLGLPFEPRRRAVVVKRENWVANRFKQSFMKSGLVSSRDRANPGFDDWLLSIIDETTFPSFVGAHLSQIHQRTCPG